LCVCCEAEGKKEGGYMAVGWKKRVKVKMRREEEGEDS
jgi:hypothetical protein